MANIKARKVHKFDFKPFSQKQLRVLNWWSDNSPVKDRRMMIADGSIRAGNKNLPIYRETYILNLTKSVKARIAKLVNTEVTYNSTVTHRVEIIPHECWTPKAKRYGENIC